MQKTKKAIFHADSVDGIRRPKASLKLLQKILSVGGKTIECSVIFPVKKIAGMICLFIFIFLYVPADEVVFQQGVTNEFSGGSAYSGTRDTYINISNSRNYGGITSFAYGLTGSFYALLRFDLSSLTHLASKITIHSASIELVPRAGSGRGEIDFGVYALNSVHAGWVEGTGEGGAADLVLGATCGTHFLYDTVKWSGGGVFSTADYDFSNPLYTGRSSLTSNNIITLPPDIVLSWIKTPANNAGIVFVANDTTDALYTQVFSSRYSTVTHRPKLVINYTVFQSSVRLIMIH
ncbi:MAG: DNRLRE domain-containing protein [Kiritimatiellales bacterium]